MAKAHQSKQYVEARQRLWGRLISDLEDDWDSKVEDGDDQNKFAPGILSRGAARHARSQWGHRGGGSSAAVSLKAWTASHRRGEEHKPTEVAEWREYLEKSAKLLHSLVRTIVAGSSCSKGGSMAGGETQINPRFITIKNVVVRESKILGEGEITAEFVNCGDSIFRNSGEGGMRKKYRAMDALGKMAYEMFMLGEGPSVSKISSKSSGATSRSLSESLILYDREPSKKVDEEDEMIKMLRKNPRTLTSEEQDCCDVLSDLKQMVDSPGDFLHASSPDRWKLTFGDKLYGRDEEMKAFRDAAERVAAMEEDPIFDGLSLLNRERKEVVMVYGSGGAGKSRLVRSAGTSLEKRGWRFLRCKFDRLVHREPLSILAYAFDQYFGSFASCPKQGNSCCKNISPLSTDMDRSWSGSQEMRKRLERIVGLDGLGILIKHIPSLRFLLNTPVPEDTTIEQNETMMHILFGKLLKALSSRKTPILFFIDDLQWADPLSLGMLSALVRGVRPDLLHLSPAGDKLRSQVDLEDDIHVMFAGSYRHNEVDDSHQLAKVLRQFQDDSSVNVTNISLSGLTLEALSKMLSETLCVPVRRARPLSELVIQKTDGQPLHVIEFIQALAMDKLLTHSFARGWEWDADSIDICPITENVAELFALKLQRLPRGILLGLQILSCFGSQIDQRVLCFLADDDGESSVDITAAIDAALSEGLMEQVAHLASFSHDIIQKPTLDSIKEDALIPLLRKLASALIKNATAANELDSILFMAVDLVNRIGSDATSSPDERALFAELNSCAASKSITVPDFASAAKYAENGITFLSDCHWEAQYGVSLQLYETDVLSHFSCLEGNRDLLKERINAVFDHAKNFSDKFKTHSVWIKLLAMTDLSQAIEESLTALNLLGEPLDLASIDYGTVCDELVKTQEKFSGKRRKKFSSTRRMADRNKVKSMEIMSSLVVYYHLKQSFLGVFVSCQMLKISMDYGHCEASVFGTACFSAYSVNFLRNIDEGSAWARTALSLMEVYDKDILIPSVYSTLYGTVFVWKEPIQSTLEPLARSIRLSFASGNFQFTFPCTIYYQNRSFNSGKDIRILAREVEALACQLGNHFGNDDTSGSPLYSPLLQFHLTPLYNILCDLKGNKKPNEEQESSFPLDKVKLADNDQIMEFTVKTKQLSCLHSIVFYQTVKSFLLGAMGSALKYTDIYFKYFLTKNFNVQYIPIFHNLYEGLITLHFMRRTGEERYRKRGECALLKMKEWSKHSDWNFKNKLLLLEAEMHYARGDYDKAAMCYEASISAAHQHKFIQEEAIASELAGMFFFERGLHPKAYRLLKRSIQCYGKWGAHAVVRRVEESIQNKFDLDLMRCCPAGGAMTPSVVLSFEGTVSKKRPVV